MNKNFIKNLTEKLLLWTGERWIISLSKNDNAKSIFEINMENKTNTIEEFKKSHIAKDIEELFPDAKLIDVQEEKMNNFTDMLSKAKAMQDKMRDAQEQIKKIEVEGIAGGNLVKVVLTGDYEIKSITLSDEAKKESQDIINDLIKAAYNNAKNNLKKKSAEELSKVTGGLNLPLDFKLPF